MRRRRRCGLHPGSAVFEIGAGTGTATRRLLELGADPLIAIEPDPRLADFLRSENPDKALQVVTASFEEAVLKEKSFDLGVSATAFHWLEEEPALPAGEEPALPAAVDEPPVATLVAPTKFVVNIPAELDAIASDDNAVAYVSFNVGSGDAAPEVARSFARPYHGTYTAPPSLAGTTVTVIAASLTR